VLNCIAKQKTTTVLNVPNPTDKEVKYTVWTDLQNAVGIKEIVVQPKKNYPYSLEITPLLGGVYTASITFVDQEQRYYWWTVEVRTDSPPPSETIDMRAKIRKAASAEISLHNPQNEPITFDVYY
jgi:hypothetical protein